MTIKELRKMLENLPENTNVTFLLSEYDERSVDLVVYDTNKLYLMENKEGK